MSKRKTYGPHKVRTMARSILPSTHRSGAREDLANIKRANRHNINQALHVIDGYDAAVDYDRTDLDYYPAADIHYAVFDRRNGDKIHHFVRWAKKITDGIDDETDRYWHIKNLMPDNLPGRHALTHLPWEPYDDPNAWSFTRWQEQHKTEKVRHKARVAAEYLAWHDALYMVCTTAGKARTFNTILKNNWRRGHQTFAGYRYTAPNADGIAHRYAHYETEILPCCAGPRLLHGTHDIDGWLTHRYDRNNVRRHRHDDTYTKAEEWLTTIGYLTLPE